MKTFEHGGNIHKVIREANSGHRHIDFSANINPLGPPEWFRPLISSQLEQLIHYPDPENATFVEAIATYTGISPARIVAGNGTTELLYATTRLLECKRLLIPVPSYVDYARAAKLAGIKIEDFSLLEEDDFAVDLNRLARLIQPEDLVIIGTPNNPTGQSVERSEILSLAREFPGATFLIDEAFLDFVESGKTLGGEAANLFTLNSMTKFYGVPGLRIGYGIFSEDFATTLQENLPPWSVNSLAQSVGARALEDLEYQEKSRLACRELRKGLEQKLSKLAQLRLFPSEANYIFIKLEEEGNVADLAAHCLEQGIIIRRCENYRGLASPSSFFRVAVRTEAENNRLVEALSSYCQVPVAKNKVSRKAKSIMFQGTCSDAGKSIITAALCRILHQDGLKIAPFKAQNMSLNSFVTLQGDEMGRAQVVQAQAARLDPDCRMNPILLKPNSDTGSQIIVCGKPVGNMSVLEYNDYKPQVWASVCSTYDSLSEEYDAIVLEGAGSPGEVNLKADDIVNMKMAQYADAPVILVGDIDRGGVYASFVGIMEVLAEWERQLVAGFLVNKFRGQESLLQSAHDYVELHTGRKVFGVVPYLPNLGLPEEDSVSFKKGSFNKEHKGEGVEIAVINLPHISNFTDIEPFLEEPDVTIRIVDTVDGIGHPQAIILPGSKNVIHDLQFIESAGFGQAINRCIDEGCEVVGICGGYQMLGKVIRDPYEIESTDGQVPGLGFLAMETVIEQDKNLTRKAGIHRLSEKEIYGYEIHHGISTSGTESVLQFDDGSNCGLMDSSEKIWGSYLHGIFDSDEFRRWFLDRLRKQIGLPPINRIVAPYDLEEAFDRLAATVRERIDMDEIYSLMQL